MSKHAHPAVVHTAEELAEHFAGSDCSVSTSVQMTLRPGRKVTLAGFALQPLGLDGNGFQSVHVHIGIGLVDEEPVE